MILEHCDVTLVSTNNQEVPCHRFILAARSPVFKRLFTSQAATGKCLNLFCLFTFGPQLSPEIFDPRKMNPNFLEAHFEYFKLSLSRDDENE